MVLIQDAVIVVRDVNILPVRV